MWWPAAELVPIRGDHTGRLCQVMAERPCAITPMNRVRRPHGTTQPASTDLSAVIRR
jgi:hypothetical protein